MRDSENSIPARLLRRLAGWIFDYPRLFFYPQAILFFVAILYTVANLEFSTNRDDLVGSDRRYHRVFLEYQKLFPVQNEIVAVIESEDQEKNRQFVERLGARLQAETNLFEDVIFNNDVKMLGKKALLFFPESDLAEFGDTLQKFQPFIRDFSQATNLESLYQGINHQFLKNLTQVISTSPIGSTSTNDPLALANALPALQRITDQAREGLHRPGIPPSPGLTTLFGGDGQAQNRIYVSFAAGKLYLVITHPVSLNLKAEAVKRFRELLEATRREVPGVNAAATGGPILEFDEMRQSQRDTIRASIISLVLVSLIFIYGYQESGRPLKATACLIFGLAYTMAFATATVGHLNVLTITFVPMLVGLAIDFGIHLVTRYEEELRYGKGERRAIEQALVHAGQGIFTGCFTTSGAFLAMGFTDFKGIQEMGIICGGGLLVCLIPMMTLLPVLLLRGRQNVLDHDHLSAAKRRARIEQTWLNRPLLVVCLTGALCGLAYLSAQRVHFDYNLLHLQSKGLPAVVMEEKLMNSAEKSLLYCAVVADSEQQALAFKETVSKLPSVHSVDSIAPFLVEDQNRKLLLVRGITNTLADVDFQPLDTNQANIRELSGTLWRLGGYLGLATDEAAARGQTNISQPLRALRYSIARLRNEMLALPQAQAAQQLTRYQTALLNDVRNTFQTLKSQDAGNPLQVADLPPPLRNRFVSTDGTQHLLQVYPVRDLRQRENQGEFIGELRQALDPEDTGTPIITGLPIQLYEYTRLLKESYEEAARYSLIAIVLLVLVHFRSLVSVVLTLIPVAVGSLWMVGIMGQVGIPFNPANIMTLPLVIGIGVASGIHILNRFMEERNPGILAKSTGKAVLISGLTTIVGFGSLILAKHQGIASLGFVMAIGTATCMVAALTVLPAVLTLLGRIGWGKKGKEKTQ